MVERKKQPARALHSSNVLEVTEESSGSYCCFVTPSGPSIHIFGRPFGECVLW